MAVDCAVELLDASCVGAARRATRELAAERIDRGLLARAELVATELASNVVKHAGRGWLFARCPDGGSSIEILSVDRGPGIARPDLAIADGFSTSGTRGTGLGSIHRQSQRVELWSVAGAGTAVLARLGSAGDRDAERVGGLRAPKPGEVINGDAWTSLHRADESAVLVSDGVGHGPDAAAASARALEAFHELDSTDPTECLAAIHEALRPTRGACIAIAALHHRSRRLRYAGIGNVGGAIVSPDGQRGLVSMHGTAGSAARTIREFDAELPRGAVVVMHSDGITTRGEPPPRGLLTRHPSLIAAQTFCARHRGNDDAVVVVLRADAERKPHE